MDLKVFRDISYGMYVVSSKDEKNVGCFINTLIQITSSNPTVAISVNKENYTNEVLKKKKRFAVSILKESASDKVISIFGYSSSKEIDKFENVLYEEVLDVPVVKEDMVSYIICDVINVVDCGSHDLFIGSVINSAKLNEEAPMTYKYYHEVLKGKSPKKAPTYVEEEISSHNSNKYQCSICGYIYDDDREKIKFEDLPDDWKCPRCGVGKEMFVKL